MVLVEIYLKIGNKLPAVCNLLLNQQTSMGSKAVLVETLRIVFSIS
jgi:hypothetical protein